METISKNIKNT